MLETRKNGIRLERVRGCYRLGGFENPSARKDRETLHQQALVIVEQVVAPFDCRLERLVPCRGRAATTGQEREPGESIEDLRHRQRLDARGRQLDRKWNAVKSLADSRNEWCILVRERPRGARQTRPVDE